MITATIYGTVPSKSNAYRIARNRMYKSKELTSYEDGFVAQCGAIRDLNIGWFEFYVDVYYPDNRRDLDNALKILLDCLQKTKTIQNDNKCVLIVASKHLDPANPRIELVIKPVEIKKNTLLNKLLKAIDYATDRIKTYLRSEQGERLLGRTRIHPRKDAAMRTV